jgi:hypothetical protein
MSISIRQGARGVIANIDKISTPPISEPGLSNSQRGHRERQQLP